MRGTHQALTSMRSRPLTLAWYKAGGSQQKLEANLGRMIASCQAFLDLDRVESHPFSEYLFER